MAGEAHFLLEVIKGISKQTLDSTNPMCYVIGKVVSDEYKPLEIQVDAFAGVLKENDLILTNAVKDHWQDIEVYCETVDDNDLSEFQANHYANVDKQNANVDAYNSHTHPNTGGASNSMTKEQKRHTSHLHNIQGRKKIRVYNGLHNGETVLLLRCPGGQQYIVLDRLSPHVVGGEWRTHSGAGITEQETAPFAVTDSKVISGWKSGANDESKWKRFSKPGAYTPGGEV